MKKFFCVFMLFVMLLSMPLAAFAKIRADRIGENIISNVLSTVITDAIRKSGKLGGAIGNNEDSSQTSDSSASKAKTARTSGASGTVTELSPEQYQSFSEICLAGSIEEFRKKIEYENISYDAKFVKEDGSEITLLEMAKSSPNPELAEYIAPKEAEPASDDVKGE